MSDRAWKVLESQAAGGGRPPKTKGDRREREFAALVNGARVPLSGAVGGAFAGDVQVLGLAWEVKARWLAPALRLA